MIATELAWAAGFFDGEGWISPNNQSTGYVGFVVGIAQKDIRPLQRFLAALDMTEGERSKGNVRKIHDGRLYQLMWSGKGATAVLHALWPHLCEPKREQTQRVLEHVRQACPKNETIVSFLVRNVT